PVAAPWTTRLRVAASATAGTSGSTYCGSFDWLSVKKSSGTSTQHANSSGSAASGSRRAPGGPGVPHAREGGRDPGERRDREDRQVVPQRRRAVEGAGGYPLERL